MLKLITKSSVTNKIILLRLDLNVPVYQNKILSDFRIIKSIPTIKYLLDTNNKVIILSHFGRPKEGQKDPSLSLKNISAQNINLDKYKIFCLVHNKKNKQALGGVWGLISTKKKKTTSRKKKTKN